MKYYDCEILYHPGKANVVADGLSRRGHGNVSSLHTIEMPLQKEIINAIIKIVTGSLANLTLQSSLLEQIREGQKLDEALVKQEALVQEGGSSDFTMSNGGLLRYKDRICVPDNAKIREREREKKNEKGRPSLGYAFFVCMRLYSLLLNLVILTMFLLCVVESLLLPMVDFKKNTLGLNKGW